MKVKRVTSGSGAPSGVPAQLWKVTPRAKLLALVASHRRLHYMPRREQQLMLTMLFAVPSVLLLGGFQRIKLLEEWWYRETPPEPPQPCRKKTMLMCD